MNSSRLTRILGGWLGIAVLSGCAAMTSLPDSKLLEAASAVVGKPMKSVDNVRGLDDVKFFDAHASDGSVYSCSLQVVLGISSQRQKCEKK